MEHKESAQNQELVDNSKKGLLERKKGLSEMDIENNISERFHKIKWKMKLPEVVINRFKLLEQYSFLNEYSEMVSNGAGNILTEIYKDKEIELPEWKLLITKLAALIHDIGKSGPAGATSEQQLAVTRLYAVESMGIGEKSIENMVQEKFEDADQMISSLKGCGIDVSVSMRTFWDMHITWGYEILKEHKEELPLEAITIAGMHHAYKGLNSRIYNPLIDGIPEVEIPSTDMMERASLLGILEEYLLVVVFDNYEAFVHRGGLKPKDAIEGVRSKIPKEFSTKYPLINEILNKMEKMDDAEITKIFEEKSK
ncbi:MAG: hypothetical protein WC870_01380 [Candidatus Paceibacterota bacterium]